MNRVQTKAKRKYAVRQDQSGKKENICRRCGYNWPHVKSPCPAQGKQCGKCRKFNHFQKCCKSKPKQKARESRKTQYVKEMHTPKQQQTVVSDSGTESDSDEYMYAIYDNQNTDEGQPNKIKVGSMNTRSNAQIKVTAFVKETPFQEIVDTGCTIDLIDSQTFNRIKKKWPDLCLKPTKKRAFSYNCEKPIKLLRKFETAAENNNKITVTTIYFAAGKSGCLLKSKTAEE